MVQLFKWTKQGLYLAIYKILCVCVCVFYLCSLFDHALFNHINIILRITNVHVNVTWGIITSSRKVDYCTYIISHLYQEATSNILWIKRIIHIIKNNTRCNVIHSQFESYYTRYRYWNYTISIKRITMYSIHISLYFLSILVKK